jgi:hypothetical protein
VRNTTDLDLIKLQENTTTMGDREINIDKGSVNFSLNINGPRKGDPKEQLQILGAMSTLLSQNCTFSFTCNN